MNDQVRPSALQRALDAPAPLGAEALDDLLDDSPQSWGVAEAAGRLGMSPHTLRYYERIGLIAVPRDAAGRRRYDAVAMRRLVFLARMRASGMSIADLARYTSLLSDGPGTAPERAALLRAHRDALRGRIEELRLALAVTEYKIATYEEGPQP